MFTQGTLCTFAIAPTPWKAGAWRLTGVAEYVAPAGPSLHQVRVLYAQWEDGCLERIPRVELFYTDELTPVTD